jgi:hypothetical protein
VEPNPWLKNLARRSKQRAGAADEEVGVLAERWKALRNEGTSMLPPTLFTVNDSLVISNLSEIGISLGDNEACVSGSLATIKEKAAGRLQENSHVMLTE